MKIMSDIPKSAPEEQYVRRFNLCGGQIVSSPVGAPGCFNISPRYGAGITGVVFLIGATNMSPLQGWLSHHQVAFKLFGELIRWFSTAIYSIRQAWKVFYGWLTFFSD